MVVTVLFFTNVLSQPVTSACSSYITLVGTQPKRRFNAAKSKLGDMLESLRGAEKSRKFRRKIAGEYA